MGTDSETESRLTAVGRGWREQGNGRKDSQTWTTAVWGLLGEEGIRGLNDNGKMQ